MKIIIVMLAFSASAKNCTVVRNYNYMTPPTPRVRRATRPTVMARNTFTLNALAWSKQHGGWVHKTYNVSGNTRKWNMTNVKVDLKKAFVKTKSGARGIIVVHKNKTSLFYAPKGTPRVRKYGETKCPSYYMMGGAGYKYQKTKGSEETINGNK